MDKDSESSDYLNAGFSCLEAGFSTIPQFMSPYIHPIINILGSPQIVSKLDVVHKCILSISQNAEHRVVFQECNAKLDKIILKGDAFLKVSIDILNESLNSAKQKDVVNLNTEWVEFFISLFDSKNTLDSHNDMSEDDIMRPILDLFTKFTLKLNEKVFKPVVLRLVDWAFADLDAKNILERQVIFFKLTERLLGTLQSIFVPYWSYFIEHALEKLVQPDLQKKLWRSCVKSIGNMLALDTVGFTTRDRFDQLAPALVNQINLEMFTKVFNFNLG